MTNLKENAMLVDALGSALSDGVHACEDVPPLLLQVLDKGAWREFITQMGKVITYKRFSDFVETPPLAGLGVDIEQLERVVSDNQTARDELDKVLKNPHGNLTRMGKNPTCMDDRTVDNVNSSANNTTGHTYKRPDGNSVEHALRKLRKDRPDLHTRVLAGEISPHKAMVEAGFRRPTISIDPSSPQAARTLIEKASPEFLAELRRLLSN